MKQTVAAIFGLKNGSGGGVNGDGDADDLVLYFTDLANAKPQVLEVAMDAEFQIDQDRFLFPVSEVDNSNTDLNGDGEDFVLHLGEVCSPDQVGVFRAGLWALDDNGKWDGLDIDKAFWLGTAGDVPAVGAGKGLRFSNVGLSSPLFARAGNGRQSDSCGPCSSRYDAVFPADRRDRSNRSKQAFEINFRSK